MNTDKPANETQPLEEDARIMINVLNQWKCPACGGSGQYKGFSRNSPNGGPCRKCGGNGLHPVATETIRYIQEGK
jgi:DnaJ-class molecular chaperone